MVRCASKSGCQKGMMYLKESGPHSQNVFTILGAIVS